MTLMWARLLFKLIHSDTAQATAFSAFTNCSPRQHRDQLSMAKGAKRSFSQIAPVGEHGAKDADDSLFADVQVTVNGETFPESASALANGSPVLRAMLGSQMREGITKMIDLPGKSAAEYATFRQFFRTRPAIDSGVLSVANVDAMLPWFHEYQMSKMLHESEEILMKQPVTTERLLQASMYDLEAQYKRCLESVAERFSKLDVGGLELHPKIVADLFSSLKVNQINLKKRAKSSCKSAVKHFKKQVRRELTDLSECLEHEHENLERVQMEFMQVMEMNLAL
eukprot:TRINITY_DN28020_c0_g2_i2.p1 TRINITY_DN28020_c0_g2~~TRINITY_DN28020_c0_g2_i2.p1  ORF type:complete len:306 (-),score=57.41 TRINITY_DN28020_c0_g2_i2:381-1226(-)